MRSISIHLISGLGLVFLIATYAWISYRIRYIELFVLSL